MIITDRTYAADLHQPRHAHDTMSVTVVLAGTIYERVGDVEEIARPLSVVVKPVDVEHENRFGSEPVRTLQIALSEREAADLARTHASMRRWQWRHHGVPMRPFVALARALRTAGAIDGVELAAVDALAAIDPPGRVRTEPPRVIRQLLARLDEERRHPSVRVMAADASLHPVYLARLFRRYVGSTISQYVQRRRVRDVITHIARQRTSLSAAAHACGFADHAHMCRVFRSETGVTPSEYRAVIA